MIELYRNTYFPQSFLMPRSLFLFSGETGDCCPESTPEDRGDWSDRTHSSSLSGRPAGQKHENDIICPAKKLLGSKTKLGEYIFLPHTQTHSFTHSIITDRFTCRKCPKKPNDAASTEALYQIRGFMPHSVVMVFIFICLDCFVPFNSFLYLFRVARFKQSFTRKDSKAKVHLFGSNTTREDVPTFADDCVLYLFMFNPQLQLFLQLGCMLCYIHMPSSLISAGQ